MAKNVLTIILGLLAAIAVNASPMLQEHCPEKFILLDSRCVHINTDTYDGLVPAWTWIAAFKKCNAMAPPGFHTELASVTESFLSSFSSHIVNNIPGMKRYTFWTGAFYAIDNWYWHDASPVDPMAYIWYMEFPNPERNGKYGALVPSGANNRFYLYENYETDFSPSFICEAKHGSQTE